MLLRGSKPSNSFLVESLTHYRSDKNLRQRLRKRPVTAAGLHSSICSYSRSNFTLMTNVKYCLTIKTRPQAD
ncbi:hypothetical protein J6590_078815 [Homalodisca vitripennis]|nr:hypothetical protein J6590_078815 [Homalodisca vitripennis]